MEHIASRLKAQTYAIQDIPDYESFVGYLAKEFLHRPYITVHKMVERAYPRGDEAFVTAQLKTLYFSSLKMDTPPAFFTWKLKELYAQEKQKQSKAR